MAGKCNSRDGGALWALMLMCLTVLCNNSLVPVTEALWLTISSGAKCMSEEIQNNVVALGNYNIIGEHHLHDATISARVTSPRGNNLYHVENVTQGQFAFTTSEAGNYMACFWMDSHHQKEDADLTLSLDWKIGIAAKDWDIVAKKEKIEGVELDLRRLEGAVEAIHNNLIFLKNREAEMREVSERTNARVAWFSMMSVGICVAVSVLQLWHLKHYFQRKKLI